MKIQPILYIEIIYNLFGHFFAIFIDSYMEENPMAGVVDDGSDCEIEYDEDGNPIAPPRKREIDPLPPIDHDDIIYKPFEKNFYTPHEDINNLSRSQVDELRQRLKVRVSGPIPPRPVASFAHFGFDERLMKVVFLYSRFFFEGLF